MSSIHSTRHLLEGYLLIDYSDFTFFLLRVVTLLCRLPYPRANLQIEPVICQLFAVFLCRLRPWQRYTINYGMWIGGYQGNWAKTTSKQPKSNVNQSIPRNFCRRADRPVFGHNFISCRMWATEKVNPVN
jgi:hypothetical protein